MHGTVARAALERPKISSEKSDESSEKSDAMRLLRLAAEPRLVGESIQGSINRVARQLGWDRGRAREIWYGNARRISVREMDALRVVERSRIDAEELRQRARNLEQLAVLRTRLSMRDAEFHAQDIAALDWMLREIG